MCLRPGSAIDRSIRPMDGYGGKMMTAEYVRKKEDDHVATVVRQVVFHHERRKEG